MDNLNRKRNLNNGVTAEALEDEFDNLYSIVRELKLSNSIAKTGEQGIQSIKNVSPKVEPLSSVLLTNEVAFLGSGANILVFGNEFRAIDFTSKAKKYFCSVQAGDILVFHAIRVIQIFDNVTKFYVVCDATNYTDGHFLVDEGETLLDAEFKTSGNPVLRCVRPGDIYFYLEGAPTIGSFYFQAWIVRNMGGIAV